MAVSPTALAAVRNTHLSPREREILGLLGEGRLYKEIAQILRISTGTVRTHISHIYAKLHARNRMEAVRRGESLRLGRP